ncbi:iron-containing alcohol dehydrogenase [Anaerovirgula multivorans]|uniref:iron-containing alcohol dehydrogenase n=1 Tax=Anaerovirgula multivorans TaxID=312168 RepID=UPI001FA8F424|nr:iron-containing alcohol dehydrogenase [Anaerovirgula multivorans]
MLEKVNQVPIKFVFGKGSLKNIGVLTKSYGKRAFVVTGRSSTKKTGVLDRVIGYLKEKDIDTVVFDEVESNPLTTTVKRAASLLKEHECDVVIGLGGGSSMDAAKCIAFSAVNEGDISDYIFGKEGKNALPIIAITTTAGTGSEGDSLAVLTNPETKDKKSLKSPYIYPKVSIIDPELMMTLPSSMIAATGFDALSHSVEAFLAKNSRSDIEEMALEAIGLLFKFLPKVYKNSTDTESWEKVAYANTIGGIVIDQAGVVLPHGMEHPVSGLLNATHGEGLAALFPKILEFSYKGCQEKFLRMAKVIGIEEQGLTKEEAALQCVKAFEKLLKALDLQVTLSQLGVKETHVDWLVENAMKTMTYAISNHPIPCKEKSLKELYVACL